MLDKKDILSSVVSIETINVDLLLQWEAINTGNADTEFVISFEESLVETIYNFGSTDLKLV